MLYMAVASETYATKQDIADINNSLRGKIFSILADSSCTYAGYIPVADGHNLTHRARYPQANLFEDVKYCWWMRLINHLGLKLGINDSWAGSRVSNTSATNTGDVGPDACMASNTRITNLGSNGTPDFIFFLGGGNDAIQNVPVGTFDTTGNHTVVDLTTTTWSNFADAYKTAIMRLQYYYPDTKIIALIQYPVLASVLPLNRVYAYAEMTKKICDYFSVDYIDLRGIGFNQQNIPELMPDNVHPAIKGTEMWENYLRPQLLSKLSFVEGETQTVQITHNMTNTTGTKFWYKAVNLNKPYYEELSGETGYKLDSVTVTMGGIDITNTVYSNGVINIPSVTGAIVITATGTESQDIDVWYYQHYHDSATTTSNVNSRGWALADSQNATLIGKPINRVRFKSTATMTNGKVSIGIVNAKNGSQLLDSVETTYTSTTVGEPITVVFPREITLAEGQYFVWCPQDETNFAFGYTQEGYPGATGIYTRVPQVHSGSTGNPWTFYDTVEFEADIGYYKEN